MISHNTSKIIFSRPEAGGMHKRLRLWKLLVLNKELKTQPFHAKKIFRDRYSILVSSKFHSYVSWPRSWWARDSSWSFVRAQFNNSCTIFQTNKERSWKFDLFYYAIIAFDCKNFNIHHSTRYLFNTTILNLIFLPLQDFPTLNFYRNYGGNPNTLIWTFRQMPEVRIPVKFICALIHL